MRRNSGIIGPIQKTSTTAASGVYDLFDNYNGEIDDKWPQFQVDSVSNSNGTALNEETNNTITVTTSGVPDSTTLYYSIATVSGTTLTSADFTNGTDVTGNFTVTSNSGSFILSPVGDDLSESNVVKVQIRRGSTSGDILAESENLTIADAAAPPSGAPEFNWRYYAYGNSIGITYVYWIQTDGTQSELREAYGQQQGTGNQPWKSYSEDLSSYSGTTGRIYIAYKTGSGYKNDPQFDNMELIDTTSGDISLDPGTSTGRSRWEKRTYYTSTTSAPTTSTFSTIYINTTTSGVWNYDAGGTPSAATGCGKDADGSTSGYYLYFEGSNPNNTYSNRYYWVRMTSDYTLL